MNFRELKDAIQYANEHVSGEGYFNKINLTANLCTNLINEYENSQFSNSHSTIHVVNYLYSWANHPLDYIDFEKDTRVCYLFGDFGSGKSGVCKELVRKLYLHYEETQYTDTTAKPILPLYFNLRLLTGIYNEYELANKSLAELIEIMFCVTGIPQVSGDELIKLIRQYPCVVVYDGFDEVVQKLGKFQQNSFLNKLLSVLPPVQYTKDLMRLIKQSVEESTIPDSTSRIVISCKNQIFESQREQQAFCEAYYTTMMSLNGYHNYIAYNLCNLTQAQVKKALYGHVATLNTELPIYKQLNVNQSTISDMLDCLVDVSCNPLLLSLTKSLIPKIQVEIEKNGSINAAELIKDLVLKLIQRDRNKGVINLSEKQGLFGALALKIWQNDIEFISLYHLQSFFYEKYKNYHQLQLSINTGKFEFEVAFQDFHSSILIRDQYDNYRFFNSLIYDYFLAQGLFDQLMTKNNEAFLVNLANCFSSETTKKKITDDALIFLSQMVLSLLQRRDMHSYNLFYNNWFQVCTVNTTEKQTEPLNEIWEIVMGEPLTHVTD